MVRAILDGQKTQTRRVMKPQPEGRYPENVTWWKDKRWTDIEVEQQCPYGQPGDRMWVKETCWIDRVPVQLFDPPYRRCFFDDGEVKHQRGGRISRCPHPVNPDFMKMAGLQKRTPSIHMPRWASRITLEIVAVRFEMLCDITDDDALAEGARNSCDRGVLDAYRDIWETINGPGSWDLHPWVWAVTFKRI